MSSKNYFETPETRNNRHTSEIHYKYMNINIQLTEEFHAHVHKHFDTTRKSEVSICIWLIPVQKRALITCTLFDHL